jgi:DNA-binding NtrC family response regulator
MLPRPTVFVIDDDQDILDHYQATLSRQFEVTTFTSGSIALTEGITNGWPDAMLVDLMMPGIDGIETIVNAKGKGYPGAFVICSGHADKEYALRALALKAFALIEKPFSGEELLHIMRHCVTEQRLVRINSNLMTQNAAMADAAREMTVLYEQRLAEAESLMFGFQPEKDERKSFLDHKSYYESFARISQQMDVLAFEISKLQKDQENLLSWRDL